MRRAALLAGALAVLAGCASLDYIGENYEPTSHVDMFFDEADVHQEYKVMGQVIYSEPVFFGSSSKMQEKIMAKARAVGADGVIVVGFEHKRTGESTDYTESTSQKQTKKGTTSTTTGNVSTSEQKEREVRAMFIKYP